MSARWMVTLMALLLVAVACGGGDGGTGGDMGGGTASPGGQAGGDEDAQCEAGQTDGDLALYNWSEYIDPELITAFEEQHGVSVTQDEFASNEELLAKLQAGATGYDVIVPSDYMVEIMAGQDLLLPLSKDAIPNFSNVADRFTDAPYDPGNRYSAPYQWGTTGIGVNVDELGDVEASWALIFDEATASEYSGRITMLDDARESMGAALKYLGYSLNTTDEAELQEAGDLLADASGRIATYTSEGFGDLLLSGESVVAHGWSGDIIVAVDESEGSELTYLIPEEGSVIWVDNMAIPAGAPHPCTAHTFINFILDAENGAQLTNWTYYASPNEAAEEHILEEILSDESIYPPDDTMQNLEFIEDVGDATPMYEQLFTEAKS